jgi:hypothetical protein
LRVGADSLLDSNVDWSTAWVSPAISLRHVVNYSIQLKWSGSTAGMLHLQLSNDFGNTDNGGTLAASDLPNWTDITGSEQLVNGAGDHSWQVQNAGYLWVRAIWAPTSGSPTLISARFATKGF